MVVFGINYTNTLIFNFLLGPKFLPFCYIKKKLDQTNLILKVVVTSLNASVKSMDLD